MPRKSKNQKNKNSAVTPSAPSQSEYSYKVEEVAVRYRLGKPIEIVHPPHLTCLQNIHLKTVNVGGRPSVENNVRYVLNRIVGDYIYPLGKPKPPPSPVTRYGLTKLAVKWIEKEREAVEQSLAPEWAKKSSRARLIVSRDSIDNFLKRFFKKKGQRLSPKDLKGIFPSLWYK